MAGNMQARRAQSRRRELCGVALIVRKTVGAKLGGFFVEILGKFLTKS